MPQGATISIEWGYNGRAAPPVVGRTVEDFWHAQIASALRPGLLSTHLARLLARYPRLRALLPKSK